MVIINATALWIKIVNSVNKSSKPIPKKWALKNAG